MRHVHVQDDDVDVVVPDVVDGLFPVVGLVALDVVQGKELMDELPDAGLVVDDERSLTLDLFDHGIPRGLPPQR